MTLSPAPVVPFLARCVGCFSNAGVVMWRGRPWCAKCALDEGIPQASAGAILLIEAGLMP